MAFPYAAIIVALNNAAARRRLEAQKTPANAVKRDFEPAPEPGREPARAVLKTTLKPRP